MRKDDRWAEPIYTGLRVMRPFELQAVELDGQRVRVKAKHRAIDEQSVTFPPIGLRTTKGRDVVLETTVAELQRDEDGDGLTDILEGRLFTNPASADTDGDRIADGVDSAPLTPMIATARSDPRVELLSSSLAQIGLTTQRPVMVAPDGQGFAQIPSRDPSQPFRFIAGTPADFAHYDGSTQLLVLQPKELELATEALGSFYATNIELEFSEDRQSALVTWSESWTGGTFTARWIDNAWKLEVLSQWIT